MPTVPELTARYLAHNDPRPATRSALATIGGAVDPFDRRAPLHVTGSALVLHLPSKTVLFRYHPRVGAWIQLGGHGDAGESDPFVVARRESREESGLQDLHLPEGMDTDALAQVVVVDVAANATEAAHQHLDFRYLLLTEHPERVRAESSDAPLRWVSITEAAEISSEANLVPLIDAAARTFGLSRSRHSEQKLPHDD